MPLKLRTQIHPFSEKYEDSTVERDSIRNIFKNLNANANIENAVILVEDEPIRGDWDRIPEDGSRVYIRIMPEGDTPKEAGINKIGFGGFAAALGLMLMFTPAAGLGVAMIGVGMAVAFTGFLLVNMSFDVPTVKNRERPKQDPSLRGGSNQARPYGTIPVVFGRHLLSPDYAASPYTHVSSNDNAQYLRQLFCLGYDDQEVELDSLKIGDTKIKDFNSDGKNLVKTEILRNGTQSSFFTKVVKEEQVNSILKNKSDSGASGAIVRTTAANCRSIEVDIFFPTGLFQYSDKGVLQYLNCEVSAWYKPAGAEDSAYTKFAGWNLNRKDTKTIRKSARSPNLEIGAYTVRIVRETGDRNDTKQTDQVYVGSIRSITMDAPVKAERAKNLLFIATQTKASDMAQGVIDKLNCVVQSKIPDYSGNGSGPEAWTPALTANPASCVLYCLRGKINVEPVPDDAINWESFEYWWNFCEREKFYFNAVLTETRTISDLISMIAQVGRASVIKSDGIFSVVIDELKTVPVQLFTPRNSIDFSEQLIMSEVPDQIDYSFIDEEGGWAQNTRSVYNTASGNFDEANPPKTPRQESSVWGITNAKQIFRFARYQQAVSKYRRSVYSIKTDIEFIMCQKGDLIEYSGDTAMTGTAYGRVKELILEDGKIAGIVSDTLLEFGEGDYGMRIRDPNAGITTVAVRNEETSDFFCLFQTPIEKGVAEGDLFTLGLRNKMTKELVVIEVVPDDNLTAEIKCVDLAPEIFKVDDPNYVIPPFESKLTVGGLVDNGYEDIKLWNTYRTYCDYEEEPQKPKGDGSDNGWHRIHTVESRWESHKTARNIFEGEWSAPLPTVEQVENKLSKIPAADTTPPSVPEIRDVAITKLGDADITFSPSTDLESGVAEYNVWIRKKKGSDFDVRWQVAGKIPHDENADGFHFLCKTSDKFESYLCAISAIDKNFNESAKCESVEFLSEVTAVPAVPGTVRASAERDFVSLEAERVEGSDLAYTGRTYEWQLSKDGGETWSGSLSLGNLTGSASGYYVFDREKDGYPSAEDLENWRFRCRAVSYYDLRSAWKECSVTTSFYGTWFPTLTSATAKATRGRVTFNWSCGDCFGSLVHSVWLNGVKISGDLSARQFIWIFPDYKERSDFEGLKFEIRTASESGEIAKIVPSWDLSEYGTYIILPPTVAASAEKNGVTVSWEEKGEHYLDSTYDVYLGDAKVLDGISATDALLPYSSRLTVAQAASLTVKVVARTAANSAEAACAVLTDSYKGWIPEIPIMRIWGYGRSVTVFWSEQDIWGGQGCEIQVAKAYKVENGKKSVISDEDELEWFAPLLAGNPYSDLDAFKKGDAGGWLSVAGTQASFSLPLYGQPNESEATQYAYRIRAFTDEDGIRERSAWTSPAYFTAAPLTAADMVGAWKLNDKGERVKVDGALGAAQIFVEELSAISANLGVVTDGGLAGNAYNYWAVSDTVLKDGTILPRGSFRVGGPNQYIKVDPIFEDGEPTGRYNIEFVVGSFSVNAEGDIGVSGRVFTVRDSKGNTVFQSGPGGTLARVARSEFQKKGLYEKTVGKYYMAEELSSDTNTTFFSDTFVYKGEAMCLFASTNNSNDEQPTSSLMLLSESGSKSLAINNVNIPDFPSELNPQQVQFYIALYTAIFPCRHVVMDGGLARSKIWTIDLDSGTFSFDITFFLNIGVPVNENSQLCFENSTFVAVACGNEKQGSGYVKKQGVVVFNYEGQTILSFDSSLSASGPSDASWPSPCFYGESGGYAYLVCQRQFFIVYRISLSDFSVQVCFVRGNVTKTEPIPKTTNIAPLMFKNGHLICSKSMAVDCVLGDGYQTRSLEGYLAVPIEIAPWSPSDSTGSVDGCSTYAKAVVFESKNIDSCMSLGLFSNESLLVYKSRNSVNDWNETMKTETFIRKFDFGVDKTRVSEMLDLSEGVSDTLLKAEANGFPFGACGFFGAFSKPISSKFFAGRSFYEEEIFDYQYNFPNFVLKFCRVVEAEWERPLSDELRQAGVGFTEVSRNNISGELAYYISDEGMLGGKRAKIIFDAEGNLIAQKGERGYKGDTGERGKSAFELAVDSGFAGTKEEWLDSLKGPKGDSLVFGSITASVDGTSGSPNVIVETTGTGAKKDVEFKFNGLKGAKGDTGDSGPEGKSAYELAVAAGFSGSQEEWFESLKGERGIQGEKGDTGHDGQDGVSIARVEQTVESLENGGENVMTVYDSEGNAIGAFSVRNGLSSSFKLSSSPGTKPGDIWMD